MTTPDELPASVPAIFEAAVEALGHNPTRDHDARGKFRAGNLAGLRHGERSRQLAQASIPELAAAINAKVGMLVADAGGQDATGTIRRDLMTTYARLDIISDHLAAQIFSTGPLTGKGKVRASVSLYLQVADRLTRLAERLGLDRRAASVRGLSALDYMSTLHHGAQEHEHHDHAPDEDRARPESRPDRDDAR